MVYKELSVFDFVREFKQDITYSQFLSRSALIAIYEHLETEYKNMPYNAKIIVKHFIEYESVEKLLLYNPAFFEEGGEIIKTDSGSVVEIKL